MLAKNVEFLLSLRSYFDALTAGKTLLCLPLKLLGHINPAGRTKGRLFNRLQYPSASLFDRCHGQQTHANCVGLPLHFDSV